MVRYIEIILKHRVAVILGCLLVSALAAGIISHGVLASSVLKLFFGNSPEYERYVELSREFSATDFIAVAFDEPDPLSKQSLDRLSRVTDVVSGLGSVRRVESILSAQRIRGEGDELIVESYSELARSSSASAELLGQLGKDELFGGLVLSEDGGSQAILVELTSDSDRPVEVIPALIEDIVRPLLLQGYPRDALHLAGLAPESSEATEVARWTIMRIFPFTVIVLVLVVYLLFLRLWPVLITCGVAFVSILWAVAFAVFLDRQINLMIAAVPAVMVIVAFSDIIHLCSAYLLEIDAGLDKESAIRKSAAEVGTACVFTSATTFVGFISLAFVPTPIFQQVGLVLGFGVAIALLLALTLVPIFLFYLPVPKRSTRRHDSRSGRFVAWTVGASQTLAMKRPWLIVSGFVVLAVLALVGILKIEVETSFIHRLDPENRIRRSHEYLQERFVGSNVVDVYAELGGDGSFLEPDRFAKLTAAHRQLESLPRVDRVLSVVTLVEKLEGAMGLAASDRGEDAVAQELLLFEVSGGSGLDRLISEDRRRVRFTLYLGDPGLVGTAQTGHEAARRAREVLGQGIEVVPTGITFLFGDWIRFILDGQRRGLVFALLATTLMMALGLGSFRVGLLSMIPNVLPLAALGGFVGWAWDVVDSDTILVAMIGIGIAVDDTIHFLSRYRIEWNAHGNIEEAVARTFHFTGRALVQTSVILCLGFLPFATSEYFTTRILGTLLPLTLVVALLADLLLLPALIRLGIIRFPAPAVKVS